MPDPTADALCESYLEGVTAHMCGILDTTRPAMEAAATRIADHIAADRLLHVFGPGGHSNLATQEIFFRAGGLMHVSAILDEGTLLSNGALRSMAIERTPGYGRVVIADRGLGEGDLLLLVNAYGINAALIDAAVEARARGVGLIGVSSRIHADSTAPDHPARHPTRANLHDLVDIHIDTAVPIGDAIVQVPGMSERIAAVSTFANAFAESFIGTIKRECLDFFVCFSRSQLDYIVQTWVRHDNVERPHRGRDIGNNVLQVDFRPVRDGPIRRRRQLGGIVTSYTRDAA